MKIKLSILIIVVFMILLNCCKAPTFNPTTLVQTCLDSVQASGYKYLETGTLILVKDVNSSQLKTLHFGKNKLILQVVPKQMIKYYYTPGDDTTKWYITAHWQQLKRDSIFVSLELNHNRVFRYYFKAHDGVWKIRSSFVDIH